MLAEDTKKKITKHSKPAKEGLVQEVVCSRKNIKPFFKCIEISKNSKQKGLKMKIQRPKLSRFVLRLFEFDLISAFGDEDDLYNPGNRGFSIKWLSSTKQIVRFELYLADIKVLDSPTEFLTKIFTHMKNLKTLILYCGGQIVTDKALLTILRSLDQLKHLQSFTVDVTDSKITKSSIIQISKSIHKIPQLKKIGVGIGDIQFGNPEFLHLIQHGFSSLKDLRSFEISLEGRTLAPQSFNTFFTNIFSKWINLEHLQLFISCTSIRDAVVECLTKQCFSKMKRLRELELDFGNNELTDKSLDSLTLDFFSHMKSITKLNIDMHSTHVSDEGVMNMIEQGLSHMTELREFAIALPDTGISDNSVRCIAWDCLSKQKNLETLILDLDYNIPITNRTLIYITEALTSLTNLKMIKFSLELTSVDAEGIKCVSEFFSHLTKLKKLVLNLNSLLISDESIEFLSRAIGKMGELEYCILNLSEMFLSNSALTYLFKNGFVQCKVINFIKLIMSRTGISNKGIGNMLKYMPKMKSLERLLLEARDTKTTEAYVNKVMQDHDKQKVVIKL